MTGLLDGSKVKVILFPDGRLETQNWRFTILIIIVPLLLKTYAIAKFDIDYDRCCSWLGAIAKDKV